MKVLGCTHRSYCHTLGKQQDLLLQPRQDHFCIGVVHRKSWTSTRNVQVTGAAGSVCNGTAQEADDRREKGVLNTKRSFFPL